MTTVFLGLGSNQDRERNIRAALELLRQAFGEIAVSPVFESAPVVVPRDASVASSSYFNLVVAIETALPVPELKQILCEIERQCGRVRAELKAPGCPLDIDLLLYGDAVGELEGVVLPHPDVLRRAYVLLPLSLLSPQQQHPQQQKTFAELWTAFDGSSSLLGKVVPAFFD